MNVPYPQTLPEQNETNINIRQRERQNDVKVDCNATVWEARELESFVGLVLEIFWAHQNYRYAFPLSADSLLTSLSAPTREYSLSMLTAQT